MTAASPFKSFWQGGFEGADHCNGHAVQVAPNVANGHWRQLDEDYAAAAARGIKTVRESVGWRTFDADPAGARLRLTLQVQAARRHGVQVVWTLMHYGWPSGIDPFAAGFAETFAAFCTHVAQVLRDAGEGAARAPVFQPVNEISFLTWAATHTRLIHPYDGTTPERGHALKCALVSAALRACDAIWSVFPAARILHTDPLVHVLANGPGEAAAVAADARHAAQFEAWDMLRGTLAPHLGGAPRYLDLLGLNYYHGNQWEHETGTVLSWHLRDPRRVPLSALVEATWRRYARPLLLAETGHIGDGRAAWLDHVAQAAAECLDRGVPLHGVCLYPLVDRPDWNDPLHWHRGGLWDVPGGPTGDLRRRLCEPYARQLQHWGALLPSGPAAQVRAGASRAPPHRPALPAHPRTSLALSGAVMHTTTTLVVFSHLRWNFVWQRPQHLLSHMAGERRVIFIEEPVTGAASDVLEHSEPCAGVEVLRPHLRGAAAGFHDDHVSVLRAMVGDFLQAQDITDYWVWFYTPMALPLMAELAPRGVVYDCMDELSCFAHAPVQLLQRESALLKAADLVFTGGPSLYQAKQGRNANVHCFASSVDAAHFRPGLGDHPAQAALAQPRLGYFGVIDERLDLSLVAALADARSDWQIVMVGPVVKIDAAALPQRPNIHWMGQRSYDELPHFVAGWDVCLLPFAQNDSTRFISPTKTLEYLAAGKPAVSTSVRDVVALYGSAVEIADGADAFVAACQGVLRRDGPARERHAAAARALVHATSWEATAAAMGRLLDAADAAHNARTDAPLAIASPPPDAGRETFSTVILGAGPTGLAAALELGSDSLLLEREATVGGWCRSIVDKGFTFDYAGHIMFSKDPYVLALYERLLGSNLHWQDREAWVYSQEVYTRYPFQGALYGLPPKALKECILGAIEARFGPLKADGGAAPAVPAGPPRNFEEFIYRVWGKGVAKHFAIPYNRKLWAVPLDQMETSWLGGRVPMPDLEEMIEGALQPVPKQMGPNARFGYPLHGGFQALMDGFLPLLEARLERQAGVVSVSPARRTVTLSDGRSYGWNTLISTLPLPRLVQALGAEAPDFVHQAAAGLRRVSVRCVNLGIGRENITDKHWIYYPEDTVFHRIFVQGNASPHCNAPGGFGLTCEITYSEHKPLPVDGQELIDRCIADCVRVGMIRADDAIVASNQVDMPYAYVVYDHERAGHVDTIRRWAAQHDIILSGRYSEWEYYNSDHAFVAGRRAAQEARALNAARTQQATTVNDGVFALPAIA